MRHLGSVSQMPALATTTTTTDATATKVAETVAIETAALDFLVLILSGIRTIVAADKE